MARIIALLAAIAAISGAASAVTCTPSETYCGSRLLKIGLILISSLQTRFQS